MHSLRKALWSAEIAGDASFSLVNSIGDYGHKPCKLARPFKEALPVASADYVRGSSISVCCCIRSARILVAFLVRRDSGCAIDIGIKISPYYPATVISAYTD